MIAARSLGLLACVLCLTHPVPSQDPPPNARVDGRDERSPTVGMRARIEDVVFPGSALVVSRDVGLDAPISLRILATRAHGDSFRYDLEYQGLEPGRHDLTDYLARQDGSSTDDLPELVVDVQAILPPGLAQPHRVQPLSPGALGGYRTSIAIAITAWAVGLLLILFGGRRRRRLAQAQEQRRVTLADRLRPLVESAQRGDLDDGAKAELERLLLAYWRRRLGLREERAGAAMIALRDHADAGPLLRQLEAWLHRPGPRAEVDLAALLAPYRDVPNDFDQLPHRAEVGS